jgi:hypothetical protein
MAVTKVIEDLAADAERALLNRVPPRHRTAYLDGHHHASHRVRRRGGQSH